MKPASLLFVLVLGTAALRAQNNPPPSPPVNHDFDFWVGDWDVTNQTNGKTAGHNRIELKHDGRVLVENYTTPGTFSGMSVNAYDARSGHWHQCWVDNMGGVLDLYGGLAEGKMILEGETIQTGGAKQLERITWTPNPDGSVRQHWEQSTDGGKTWTTAFDGFYRRTTAKP
ncbi:MAG TPA: hypothetical protein VFJ90_14230 [Candidatus Didemnitutus sp.]|nr:hypothetical protein [Candidatus Didemnitutus sp.]